MESVRFLVKLSSKNLTLIRLCSKFFKNVNLCVYAQHMSLLPPICQCVTRRSAHHKIIRLSFIKGEFSRICFVSISRARSLPLPSVFPCLIRVSVLSKLSLSSLVALIVISLKLPACSPSSQVRSCNWPYTDRYKLAT